MQTAASTRNRHLFTRQRLEDVFSLRKQAALQVPVVDLRFLVFPAHLTGYQFTVVCNPVRDGGERRYHQSCQPHANITEAVTVQVVTGAEWPHPWLHHFSSCSTFVFVLIPKHLHSLVTHAALLPRLVGSTFWVSQAALTSHWVITHLRLFKI